MNVYGFCGFCGFCVRLFPQVRFRGRKRAPQIRNFRENRKIRIQANKEIALSERSGDPEPRGFGAEGSGAEGQETHSPPLSS